MHSHTSKRKHWPRAVAAALFVSLVAAACGSSGGSEGGGGSGGDVGTPVSGGEIVYGLEAETSDGWCLQEAQLAIGGIQVARAIYDTLTAPDENGDYEPFLAKAITPNETFDSWNIELREGIKFHDGTDLDATVVKNNLDAYRGQYPNRNPLLFIFVFANIADVTVVDDLNLTVTTKTPWPALPAALFGSGRIGIVAQAQLDDADNCDTNMIGTGPFTKVDWEPNTQFVAAKNPDYWQKDADGVQLPYLDQITFRPIIDGPARLNDLLSGNIQASQNSTGAEIKELREQTESGQINSYESEQFAETSFGQFNTSKPPFDSKTARLAAIKAIDMDTFNKVRNLDQLTNSNGPFSPGNMGYLEDTGQPTYDLEESKKLVAQYQEETGNPLSFTLLITNDGPTLQSGQLIQEMAKKVGVEVTVVPMEQAELIDRAISGDFEAMAFRNYPGGDPDIQYNWWISGSPVNFGRIDDPEVDTLLNEGRVESDQTKRTTIYENLNKRFASEGYSLWLQWITWDIGTASNVHGILGPDLPEGGKPFPGLATGHPLTGIWVDQ